MTEHKCRFCDGKLETVLDLGNLYVSGFVKDQDELIKSPLVLTYCTNCGLVQLKDTVDLDSMYRKYWYKSSLNNSMVRDLHNVIEGVEKRIELKDGDIVVDIGCNDGTMLDFYSNKYLLKVGFDPALNLGSEARKHCTWFVNDYFTLDKFPYAEDKAKVVTAIAMFYDLEKINTFVRDVVAILAKDGVFVIQLTDLYNMLKTNAFDNICFEHLEYFSLHNLVEILNYAGLEIFDVERNKVNGGSLRVYASFPGKYDIRGSFYDYLDKESNYLKEFDHPFGAFAERVQVIKSRVVTFISDEVAKGKTVALMGASTKANTLLQYFGLDNSLISYAAEINIDKFGLRTVGTNIPIIPEFNALQRNPDFFIIGPWHFVNNLIEKNYQYFVGGGSFIVPMPEPKLINIKDGWYNL